VYKNPGKHWGDVHLFDAVWDERLDPYVGPSRYTIFFSTNGDRPIVDEIANSDLDGDLYWVCNNAEVWVAFISLIMYCLRLVVLT
jgi:RNA-dependent RNA polymerase